MMPAPDGGGGFLWKPISESTGNLVVLLPHSLRQNLYSVQIRSAANFNHESLVENGDFLTDTHNGDRPHYLFDHPGAHYEQNIFVVALTLDGQGFAWPISDGSLRID